MTLAQKLAPLTCRHLLAGLCAARGETSGEAAACLTARRGDRKLSAAVHRAHARVWKAFAILLAGESFWDGCQVFLAPEDAAAFRERVRTLRQQLPALAAGGEALRGRCLRELHKARQGGLLAEEPLEQTLSIPLPEVVEPQQAIARLARELRQAGYPSLGGVLESGKAGETPVLVAALTCFLRRELAGEPELLSALQLDRVRPMPEAAESALAHVGDVMAVHGRGLQEWLEDGDEPPAAPAAGAQTPAGGERARRPGLFAWLGTAAVLVVPVLLVLWMVGNYSVQEERRFEGHEAPVTAVAFSADGKRVYSAALDRTVRIWDVATGKELRKLEGHTGRVTGLAVSPDGRQLLTLDREEARLWEAETGKQLAAVKTPQSSVGMVAFTADGPRALTLDLEQELLQLWDVPGERLAVGFRVKAGLVHCLALAPDGRRAAAGGKDVLVWDMKSRWLLHNLEGHTAGVTALAFSPEGSLLASGSIDTKIRLWSVQEGKGLGVLEGPASAVVSLAFSPDGKLLASGSSASKGQVYDEANPAPDRRTLRVWQVETGRDVALFDGPPGVVWGVAFSPDGRKVLSGGADRVMRLWPLPR